jgi:hypothetical protein
MELQPLSCLLQWLVPLWMLFYMFTVASWCVDSLKGRDRCMEHARLATEVFALQRAEWGLPFGAPPQWRVPAHLCCTLYVRFPHLWRQFMKPKRVPQKDGWAMCLRAGLVPPLAATAGRWLVPTPSGPVWLTRVSWNAVCLADAAGGRRQTLRLTCNPAHTWAQQGRRLWGRRSWPVLFGYALVLTACWKVHNKQELEAMLQAGFQQCSMRLDAQLRVLRVLTTRQDASGGGLRDLHLAAAGDPAGELRAGDPLALWTTLSLAYPFNRVAYTACGWLAWMAKVARAVSPAQLSYAWFTYNSCPSAWVLLTGNDYFSLPPVSAVKPFTGAREAWAVCHE